MKISKGRDFIMEKIKKKDGTYLTRKEMKELKKQVKKAGKKIEDFIDIDELDGILFPTIIGFVEIAKVERKKDTLLFDLKYGDYLFEKDAEYPLSKEYDKETQLITGRFTRFLDWYILKNIDAIIENDKEIED